MRYVKVPLEIAIPFLLALAFIAFSLPVSVGQCSGTTGPVVVCIHP